MLRTAELSIVETSTEPETGAANGHGANGNGHGGNGHGAGGDGHPCCTPPLEAAWLERVETTPLRRTPDDVEPADVMPSPCGDG